MIFTGSFLFWLEHKYFLGRVQFLIKMSFIIALIINGLIIGKIQKVAITHTWKNLNPKQRLPLIISGTVSTLCSLGAFTCAFFINEF